MNLMWLPHPDNQQHWEICYAGPTPIIAGWYKYNGTEKVIAFLATPTPTIIELPKADLALAKKLIETFAEYMLNS